MGDRLDNLFAGAQGWVHDQRSIWLDLGTLLGRSNQLVAARAMRGKENTQEDPVQRVSLGTDELGNCDLEIEIRKAASPIFTVFLSRSISRIVGRCWATLRSKRLSRTKSIARRQTEKVASFLKASPRVESMPSSFG